MTGSEKQDQVHIVRFGLVRDKAPVDEDGASGAPFTETRSVTERAIASLDESMEPVEASEERNAAIEAEGMKRPMQ